MTCVFTEGDKESTWHDIRESSTLYTSHTPVTDLVETSQHLQSGKHSETQTVNMKLLLVTWTMLVSSSVSQQTLSGGMREFTRLLLAELEEKSQSNFLFSPFSLHSVLSQVMLGSRGRTLAQLEQVLGV